MAAIKNASFADLVGTIRESPALLIATLVGVGAVIYIVYKSTQKQVGAPATTNSSGQSPYYVAYVDETQNQPPPINVTVNNPPSSNTPGNVTITNQQHPPGSSFRGPSGVIHYVTMGGETLTQIAQKFNAGSWNNIYAIPDNQKLFGKLSTNQLRTYKPPSGLVITLPGNARGIPTS
jgi:hypothetical protein